MAAWKNRNDAVFAASSASVESVLSRGIAWAQYYYDGWLVPTPVVNSSLAFAPWSNPELGWPCLNVDGAISLNIGKVKIGGLLRDNVGNFLFGFSKFIGCANSLQAELWSLYIGLQLAWDYGVEFLQVQTDCKQVLQLLQHPHVESCSISLMHSIRQFWKRAWFVDLIWTPRSGNKAADAFTRLVTYSSFDLSFFSSPPATLYDVLSADNLALSL
ncbi:hypothetical protein V6N12_036159 [Hibiscus sabdariffa]|uniref:RNase H type-1 domain-containing protein n=1 Tax=Hibiscus sabdariffa TaxID=183260 RepID=A0ABR2EPT3_9ROSI